MPQPLVTIEELSRLIDKQLDTEEEASVRRRLTECPVSRRLLETMQDVHTELAAAFLEKAPPPDSPVTPDCLPQEELMLLSEGKLPVERLPMIEAHLAGCQRCLKAMLLEVRSQVSMASANWRELPPEIAEHPWFGGLAQLVGKRAKKDDGERRQTEAKSRPVRQGQAPEGEEPLAKPVVPATGELTHALSSMVVTQTNFTAQNMVLTVTLRNTVGGANLEIQLRRQNKPVWEAEIGVAEQGTGQKIFRGLSGRDGRVLVRKLSPGGYDITVPGVSLRVTLAITP